MSSPRSANLHRGVRWKMRRVGITLVAALVCTFALLAPAKAVTLIRDAEIEGVIKEIADPIFRAAGLEPSQVDVFIVHDDVLNAFVAGGQNLFLHTGLLRRTRKPEELAGVIAHETGHIAGGHLSRTGRAIENAGYQSLIGALLGSAAAVAGAPQVGTALFAGGATFAERGFLAFSRSHEQAADQAAIDYLAAIELPPDGLVDFFHVLDQQNLRISRERTVYLRTHPLTRDRIGFLENQAARSPFSGRRLPDDLQDRYERARVKLDAFLAKPQDALRRFDGTSVPDRYARAIATYRIPDLDAALHEIDGLIADEPDNPYFHELKGQMLFENGRAERAVQPFAQAVKLQPSSALLRVGLARSLLEARGADDPQEAAALLREAVRLEPRNASAWRFLGIAEGRLGNQGEASVALAEHAVLVRNKRDAELFVARAQQHIAPEHAAWLQLQDLLRAVAELEEPARG